MRTRMIVILSAGALLAALTELFGPGGVQRRTIAAAERFRDSAVAPVLASDPRFRLLTATVATNGMLVIHGVVADQETLDDLKSSIHPPPNAPFRFLYRVDVDPIAATQAAQ
jgi:hypothetical protein